MPQTKHANPICLPVIRDRYVRKLNDLDVLRFRVRALQDMGKLSNYSVLTADGSPICGYREHGKEAEASTVFLALNFTAT